MRNQFVAVLVASMVLLPACRRDDPSEASLPAVASRTPVVQSSPPASASPSASASAFGTALPMPALPPRLKSCRDDPRWGQYWVRVEGDGAVQLFKEGTDQPFTTGGRICAPSGMAVEPSVSVAACETEDPKRSCVFMTEKRLTYYDRGGKRHVLQVSNLKYRFEHDVLDGTASAQAPGSHLRLKLTFHVGNDVRRWMPSGSGNGPK